MPVTYVCERCGSKLVTLDAWAEWSEAEQAWVLGATYDYTFCHKCEQETRLVEKTLRRRRVKAAPVQPAAAR